ncbi:hypothetical protein QWZ14_16710 [Paeniroseomonas aquatica]|uniref:Uncharacterized protein n=1 Tax=Paeniroseomonas aquatica TaxID=373043 RepID=A0ABT8A894_9PROT|nr:hypothetical protein [Paeniroseomonas aquatica]MDN3566012.1 hypothetical protein [Paeniroseomonas aquatica]
MADGSSLGGPYQTPPSPEDERILEPLRRQKPEEIPGLLWAAPDFYSPDHKIVRTFSIDRKKRPGLDFVPCAICSNNHPKFLEGAVLWSPDGWLRVIGHICAARPEHFGELRYRRLRRLQEQETLDSIAFNWLHANASAVRPLIVALEELRQAALFIERQQKAFFRDVRELAELLENTVRRYGGALAVEQESEGARLVAEAVSHPRAARAPQRRYELVNLGTLQGQAFLIRPRTKRSQHLEGIIEALRRVPEGEDDQPLLELIDKGGEQEITITAGLVFRAMQRALKLAEQCAEATRFVSNDNLRTLEAWGQDGRNPLKFTIRRHGTAAVGFRLVDLSQVTLPTAWPRVPDLPEMQAIVGAGMALDALLPKSAGTG